MEQPSGLSICLMLCLYRPSQRQRQQLNWIQTEQDGGQGGICASAVDDWTKSSSSCTFSQKRDQIHTQLCLPGVQISSFHQEENINSPV